jgi:hypothetical protein
MKLSKRVGAGLDHHFVCLKVIDKVVTEEIWPDKFGRDCGGRRRLALLAVTGIPLLNLLLLRRLAESTPFVSAKTPTASPSAASPARSTSPSTMR